MDKLLSVNFKKPLYDSFCNINEETIDKAIRFGFKLEVTIPQGVFVVDPVEWKRTGIPTEQVYRFKDRPMKMIGNYVIKKEVDIRQQQLI